MPDYLIAPIDEYCDYNGYEDMLVTVQADGEILTIVLEFDAVNGTWCWSWDWYEGQKNVELLGFVPLSHIKVVGMEVHYNE